MVRDRTTRAHEVRLDDGADAKVGGSTRLPIEDIAQESAQQDTQHKPGIPNPLSTMNREC